MAARVAVAARRAIAQSRQDLEGTHRRAVLRKGGDVRVFDDYTWTGVEVNHAYPKVRGYEQHGEVVTVNGAARQLDAAHCATVRHYCLASACDGSAKDGEVAYATVLTQASIRADEPYADVRGAGPDNKRLAQVTMCVGGRLPHWIGTQRATNNTAELTAIVDSLRMVPMVTRHLIATDSLMCYDLLDAVSTKEGRRDVRRRTRMPWRSLAQSAVTYYRAAEKAIARVDRGAQLADDREGALWWEQQCRKQQGGWGAFAPGAIIKWIRNHGGTGGDGPLTTAWRLVATAISRRNAEWSVVHNNLRARWAGPRAEKSCLLYTSPSPRDQRGSRMPSSA